jgi:hypothetical protein
MVGYWLTLGQLRADEHDFDCLLWLGGKNWCRLIARPNRIAMLAAPAVVNPTTMAVYATKPVGRVV